MCDCSPFSSRMEPFSDFETPYFAQFDLHVPENALLCSVLLHLWLSKLTVNICRPSQQPRRVKQRKEKQRLRARLLQKELLLRKERLLLQKRKLHLQKSREMCDSSSSSSSWKGRSQSRCHPIAVSPTPTSSGDYLLRFSCV